MQRTKRTLDPDYKYRAKVTRIKDGDTIVCDFDLGMYTGRFKQTVRFANMDTAELRGPDPEKALEAKVFLEEKAELMNPSTEVIIETTKDKKGNFGRWLGIVWYRKEGKKRWTNLNEELVRKGLARRL